MPIRDIVRRVIWAAGGLAAAKLVLSIAVPLPDARVLSTFVNGAGGPLLKLYNFMGGGALARGSAFALGIMPYLSARIFMALVGRKNKWWTRGLTLGISVIQGIGYARFTETLPGAVAQPGLAYTLQTVLMLTTVSTFVMLFAEEATSEPEVTETVALPRERVEEQYPERNRVHATPITPLP